MKWQLETFNLRLLQRENPLLRQEIQHAIVVHNAAIENITARGDHHSLNDLDTVQAHIHEHWTKVYSEFVSHARLMQNIEQFQTYLTIRLLGDYVGKPWTNSNFELEQLYLVEQYDVFANTSDEGNRNNNNNDGIGGKNEAVDSEIELLTEAY